MIRRSFVQKYRDMGKVHDNIYIPETWPHWIWWMIEFAIVFAVGAVISREIMTFFENAGYEEPIRNWLFWGFVGLIISVWYIVIRGWILKKPILRGQG